MAIHKVTLSYQTQAGISESTTATYTDSTEINITETIPISTTNQPITVSFPHATIVALNISANTPLTIKTNSSSAPANTLNVGAALPLIWTADMNGTNPITADVTELFVSNASATVAATLIINVLLNI